MADHLDVTICITAISATGYLAHGLARLLAELRLRREAKRRLEQGRDRRITPVPGE